MNDTNNINSSSLLRRLLIEPEYRIPRHLLLISVIIVISLNQAFMTFINGLDVLGYRIYLQAGLIFVSYMLTGYFNYFYLLPRYLLRKQYVRYTLSITLSVFLLVALQTAEEYYVLTCFHIYNTSYALPIVFINLFSSFALILPSLSGPAMTILLKYWLTENEKIGELEKRHIQSEVEQLKEQVSPHLLFGILNRAGVLALRRPKEASDMLIRLGQLLRYQLYDCNRERVLLSGEIKFLNNYLTLEQACSHALSFTIREDEGAAYTLVPPLLFISFVQAAVINIHGLNVATALDIEFRTTDRRVTFGCSSRSEALFAPIDYSRIYQRLNLLYPNRHSLIITDHRVTLNLES